MNTTPTMTLDRERTDAAASAHLPEPKPATGSFQTVEPRIEVAAPLGDRYGEILTPEALAFLAELHDRFAHTRHELLAVRLQNRVDAANGRDPRFLPETEWIRRDASWRVAGPGPGLEDRRVEITGPTDRKMAINALNSGAEGVARRPGGCHEPDLGERDRGAADAARLPARTPRVHEPRRPGVPRHGSARRRRS